MDLSHRSSSSEAKVKRGWALCLRLVVWGCICCFCQPWPPLLSAGGHAPVGQWALPSVSLSVCMCNVMPLCCALCIVLAMESSCHKDGGPALTPGNQPSTKFHIKMCSCQMNVNDSDVACSLLFSSAFCNFEEVNNETQVDVLLANTCATGEGAEQKVWGQLHKL